MFHKKYIKLILLIPFFLLIYSGKDYNDDSLPKPLTNDHFNFIAINEIKMWVSNNGDGSHDPNTDGSGFYWPGGKLATKAAIFEDGLIWGGIVNGGIRVNGTTHRQGLQAGKILPGGIADDPYNPLYRIYKIRQDWKDFPAGQERDDFENDYNEWPVNDGAPWVDLDGNDVYSRGIDAPEFIGDEVLWYVANDMDTSRARRTYGSDPIGLEFQTTIFGFNRINDLADVVFKKYLIINKGSNTIEDMIFGYWSDTDLGDAEDDYVGCDTILQMGYTFNGDNSDGTGYGIQYGTPPPAVGHLLLQGPVVRGSDTDSARINGKWLSGYKNQEMTSFSPNFKSSFSLIHDPPMGIIEGSIEFYNLLQGKTNAGSYLVDPITGDSTIFPFAGDPVSGTGFYESFSFADPGDRRLLVSSGPVTMAPGDSQEVIIAIGEDNIDSISELKRKSESVHLTYNLDFKTIQEINKPPVTSVSTDQSITLYWEVNSESFDQVDPFLQGKILDDSTYTFEGYRIWQFRDLEGADPKVIATYDLNNDVIEIYQRQTINGFPAEVAAIYGPNEGVRRSYTIDKNSYDDKPLNNGNPYYFAVTAYAYSEHSGPTFIESDPEIVEVIPGLKKIDQTFSYESGDNIIAEHISGEGDGTVELIVVDPEVLTGEEYRVAFNGEGRDAAYSFINYTQNDTIISDCTNFYIDTVGAEIIDGFILKVDNQGWREIYNYFPANNYVIRDLLEINGPAGIPLDPPVNIFGDQNSNGNWQISSYGEFSELLQNINVDDQIGYQNYEIRFTSTGSEHYLTGSNFGFFPWLKYDPKASDRVPFEIWDMGKSDSPEDDFRLSIKTLDTYSSLKDDSLLVDQDGKWSQLENGDWEPIFAFFQDSVYLEPLPNNSRRITSTDIERSRLGKIIIRGELPEEGTVIRISTWKPLSAGDVFSVIATAPKTSDYGTAKTNLNDISVFPNPFYGFGTLSGYIKQDFMRFINIPTQVTIRIFSLSGVYVRRIEKNDDNPYLDWDLKNNAGELVASGVYIAHLEMPNIGEKVMKLAVITENQY